MIQRGNSERVGVCSQFIYFSIGALAVRRWLCRCEFQKVIIARVERTRRINSAIIIQKGLSCLVMLVSQSSVLNVKFVVFL